MTKRMWPTPRGRDSYSRDSKKMIKKRVEEGRDCDLVAAVKYHESSRSEASSPESAESNSGLKGQGTSEQSGRSKTIHTASKSWQGTGLKPPDIKTFGTAQARFPTPQASDWKNKNYSRDYTLGNRKFLWPTPKSSDAVMGQTARTKGRPIEKSTHLQTRVHVHERTSSNTSTSSAGASRVRTSQMRAKGKALREKEADYGRRWRGWLVRYDQDTFSWRTSQLSLAGELMSFSGTWPRSGMMRSGTACPLQPSAPLTVGTGSSYWLTPATVQIDPNNKRYKKREAYRKSVGRKYVAGCLAEQVVYPTARTRGLLGGSGSREMIKDMVERGELTEEEAVQMMGVRMWPTPEAKNETGYQVSGGRKYLRLGEKVKMWPTPNTKERLYHGKGDRDLAGEVYQTPCSADWKRPSNSLSAKIWGKEGRGQKTQRSKTPQLNPEWVSWLMGFPYGWTDIGR